MSTTAEAEKATPSFVAPEHVDRVINGVEHKFYAMSLAVFFELNAIAKPVITSLSALMDPPKQTIRERLKSGDSEKTTWNEMSVDVVKLGIAARERAVSELTDALLNPKNAAILRRVISDSLRDEFTRGQKLTTQQEKEFSELDLPTAAQFVKGFVEANVEAFRPLMDGVTGKLREAFAAVTPKSP